MRTTWNEDGVRARGDRAAVAHRLGVRARSRRAPHADAAAAHRRGDTVLVLIDLGDGRNRLGGSALAQVYGQLGNDAPDLDDPQRARRVLRARAALHREGKLLAYHDRSDGGLFVTLLRDGVRVAPRPRHRAAWRIDATPLRGAVHRGARRGGAGRAARRRRAASARRARRRARRARRRRRPTPATALRIARGGDRVCSTRRASSCSAPGRRRRIACSACATTPMRATQEYDRILDAGDPGLHAALTFDPARTSPRRYIATGARPRVAILREQGVNGQVEMAAAFDRAGFDAVDVHMSDIIAGRVTLARLPGLRGVRRLLLRRRARRGRRLGQVDPASTPRARDEFAAFFARGDTFALGVCNGCQMMSNLRELIPGAAHWPHFVRNKSEQFEARFAMVEVQRSPSLFFAGMAGSRIPVAIAHGEGYAEFRDAAAARRRAAARRAALRRQSRRADRSAIRTTPTARRRASPASPRPTAASRS